MRRWLFLLVLLVLACWLPSTFLPLRRVDGDGVPTERVIGWRRTAQGWEESSRWQLNQPIVPLPTPVTAVHPLVIASLELMISIGALVVGSRASRKDRR